MNRVGGSQVAGTGRIEDAFAGVMEDPVRWGRWSRQEREEVSPSRSRSYAQVEADVAHFRVAGAALRL